VFVKAEAILKMLPRLRGSGNKINKIKQFLIEPI
jgi:hypothetical protein